MDLASIGAALSSYRTTPATDQAARDFLDLPDPSVALDRLYSFLVWQRTLRTVLLRLEDAGGDLDALVITPETYGKTFFSYKPVWDMSIDPPITGKRLLEIYATHQRLLAEPVTLLADEGVGGFALVSGRAYQARYPRYDTRAEFDTDLVVPNVAAAGEIASTLVRHGYDLDTVRIRRMGPRPVATVEIRSRRQGHLISVGLLVGGYHAHRGPIFELSSPVVLHGRNVAAARPEDLLVMLAARVENKRRFGLVNFNDAAMILESDGADLDWENVVHLASVANLSDTLGVIISRAGKILGRGVVPDEVVSSLTATGSGAGRTLAEVVARMDTTYGAGTRRADRMARRAWTIGLRARVHRRDDESLLSKLALKAEDRIVVRQWKRARSGVTAGRLDRIGKAVRPRCGTFCEVLPSAATQGCISGSGRWRYSEKARQNLYEVVEVFGTHGDDPDCLRLRFLLGSRDGR